MPRTRAKAAQALGDTTEYADMQPSVSVLHRWLLVALLVCTGCPPEDEPAAGGGAGAGGTTDGGAADASGPGSNKPVSLIALSHASVILEYDEVVEVDATVVSADGTVLTGHTILWLSDDEKVATVDGSNVTQGSVVRIQAVGRGATTINVTVDGEPYVNSRVLVSVPSAPVATLVVEAPRSSLEVGETMQLTVRALDPRGNDITAGKLFWWRSSDPSIATVNDDGLVRRTGPGAVDITVSYEGLEESYSLAAADDPAIESGVRVRQSIIGGVLFSKGTLSSEPYYSSYAPGTTVVFTPVPANKYTRFVEWPSAPFSSRRNDCSGTSPTCTLVLGTTDAEVWAKFDARKWVSTFETSQDDLSSPTCPTRVVFAGQVFFQRSPGAGRYSIKATRTYESLTDKCQILDATSNMSDAAEASLVEETFSGSTSHKWIVSEADRVTTTFTGSGFAEPDLPFNGKLKLEFGYDDQGKSPKSLEVGLTMNPE